MSAHYEGEVVSIWLPDGRNMELREPFAYIDAADLNWAVPQGARVDGASIPRFLWTLIGGPFEGKYRDASVVHDWFCDIRVRPARDTHRMFYEAMLTSGVSGSMAKILYAGVIAGGPSWGDNTINNAQLAMIRQGRDINLKASSRASRADAFVIPRLQASGETWKGRAPARVETLTAIRDLASYFQISPRGMQLALARPAARVKRGASEKPAFQHRVPPAALRRIITAAPNLSLDEIDIFVAREARGQKLVPFRANGSKSRPVLTKNEARKVKLSSHVTPVPTD